MRVAVIQGCSKGLGHSFTRLLLDRTDMHVVGLTHAGASDVKTRLLDGGKAGQEKKLTVLDVDIREEEQIKRASEEVDGKFGKELALLVNFAGVLHPEKNIASLDLEEMKRTFEINTFGHALMFKHFLPLVPRATAAQQGEGQPGRSVLVSLSARVGSIGDNRKGGWYSYRASKAATNQIVRTVAHEVTLRKLWGVALAYHPGTMKTALAGAYAADKETSEADGVFEAEQAAEKLWTVIGGAGEKQNGAFLDHRAEPVVW